MLILVNVMSEKYSSLVSFTHGLDFNYFVLANAYSWLYIRGAKQISNIKMFIRKSKKDVFKSEIEIEM